MRSDESNPLLAHFDFSLEKVEGEGRRGFLQFSPHPGPLPEGEGAEDPHGGSLPEGEGIGRQVRGVGWVLKWAGAMGVLLVAGSMLARFGYCVAAEQALARAARAGVVEATLPRATLASVRQSVVRGLAGYPSLGGSLQFNVQQNGMPIQRELRPRDGDRFSIRLVAPVRDVLPKWLSAVSVWQSNAQIEVWAERFKQGRELPKQREKS